MHIEIPSDTTAPGSKPIIGLNLISRFIQGNIQTRYASVSSAKPKLYSRIHSVLLGIKNGFSSIQHAVDDTSTALNETLASIDDSFDITLIDSAEQDLLDQQVLIETHDVRIQTNSIAHLTATGSELQPRLDRQEENTETHVTLSEDNHDMDYLALIRYSPGQHNDLDLEHLTDEQGRQDVLPENDTNVLHEINEENIRLRLQRDDLLAQHAALENDLSTSFIEKFDLEKQLSSAKQTIENGKAFCKRNEADWKRDIAKLQYMTRLFEANTENDKCAEMLRQQDHLEEANAWLSDELQMRIEDHRFFACQRQAALEASSFRRYCDMNSEIQMLRRWLSTVQTQLADTGKAKTKLEGELQQERFKHQETRNALHQFQSELKLTMSSRSYNAQQSAYAGSSTPHKPSKFTPTYPPGLQTPLPKAATSPQFSSHRKSESGFGPVTFFEPCAPGASIPQQFGTRSKSKFTFGDNSISPSTSIATSTTTGATPRTDFNFTFGGTMEHQSSLGTDGNTTESVGADQPTSAPSVDDCKMPLVEAKNLQSLDKCDHSEGEEAEEYMQAKMTADNTVGCDSTKDTGLYVNQTTQSHAQKPLASDFFDTDSVKPEVEMNSLDALAAEKTTEEKTTEEKTTEEKTTEEKTTEEKTTEEKTTEEKTTEEKTTEEKTTEEKTAKEEVPIISAGADIAQKIHIGGGAVHRVIVGGSISAGEDKETMGVELGSDPPSPPTTSKGVPKPPKNKGKTSRRAYLRKIAKARKRAEIGGADGGEIS